jgi:hypothetical protein
MLGRAAEMSGCAEEAEVIKRACPGLYRERLVSGREDYERARAEYEGLAATAARRGVSVPRALRGVEAVFARAVTLRAFRGARRTNPAAR